jgi:hypothetical protein
MPTTQALPATAFLMREIVKYHWGILQPTIRTAFRDLFCQRLFETDPVLFPTASFRPVMDIAPIAFCQLPQLSFTQIFASCCCDGIILASNTSQPIFINALELGPRPAETPSDTIARHFSVSKTLAAHDPCTNAESCRRVIQERIFILDRPPPRLCVSFHKTPAQPFSLLRFPVQIQEEEQTLEYRPIGCILFINRNHYILRWKHRTKSHTYLHYDDMKKDGEISYVKSWLEGLKADIAGSIIFYQQVDR